MAGGRFYPLAKRLVDIMISGLCLVILSPFWLAIAFLVKVTSKGPVIFQGPVVGKDGITFVYYKFRTMYNGADDSEHRKFIADFILRDKPYLVERRGGRQRKVFKYLNDPRVTPLGRVLRRFSLDEVPQMINVLKGEMSLVGPRPPVPYEYELYNDYQKSRLKVVPGITGLNQVNGRSVTTFREMVEDDLKYMKERSLWLDIKIILKTPLVILIGRGAG